MVGWRAKELPSSFVRLKSVRQTHQNANHSILALSLHSTGNLKIRADGNFKVAFLRRTTFGRAGNFMDVNEYLFGIFGISKMLFPFTDITIKPYHTCVS